MKTSQATCLVLAFMLGISRSVAADQPAKVTEVVNVVDHGTTESETSPATIGTLVHDGEYLKTGVRSRAEILLPTASVTRLGAYTIFNYSVESNTVDLQAGTILFCKPKNAPHLNIKTEAVTAGITGTTGFVSVQGSGSKKTYIFGIIEGHASATANGTNFSVGRGDILEFRPGLKPFMFAFDLPRFVKSSPLLNKFKGTLPNQSYIDAALDNYNNEVSRGFIEPPSQAIDYSGDIPILSTASYDSAQNSQDRSKAAPASSQPTGTSTFSPTKGGG